MYYVGVDLGGTKIAAGVISDKGNIICKDTISTKRERPYLEIVNDMANLINNVINLSGKKKENISWAGIGCPGTIDPVEGKVIYSNNLNFNGVLLKTEIEKNIDLPVFIDNDANCAAIAESNFGSAKGIKNSITITIGTGIGCGIIYEGKIYRGFSNAAGEIGHMLIKANGEPCSCGRKGCFEAYGSATALIREGKKAALRDPSSILNTLVHGDISKIDGKTVFDGAKLGDKSSEDIVKEYLNYLGEGIINIINIIRPEVIVLGGGISGQGEFILKPLREIVSKGVYGGTKLPDTIIKTATFGNDAGIIGASILGMFGGHYIE